MTTSQIVAWFTGGLVACGLFVGCQKESAPSSMEPTDRLMVHDAGRVIAGEQIRHTFTLAHSGPGTIQLSDDDISNSCGCSAAQVSPRQLMSGQAMKVTVELDSSHKRGEIAEVVSTTWRDAAGQSLEYAFAIRAMVQSPLAIDPPELTFSRDELIAKCVKKVVCESDLPLDWPELQVLSTNKQLNVTHSTDEHGRTVLRVSCQPSERDGHQRGHIELRVPHRDCSKEYTSLLPVFWRSPTSLRISPSLVIPKQTAHGWTATFIATGDTVRDGATLKEILTTRGGLNFQQQNIGNSAVRIKLRFDSCVSPSELPRKLTLRFSDQSSKQIKLFPPTK